jgi:hypothetical protein
MNEQGLGPTIGIIVIVLLILSGGLYFLLTQEQEKQPIELPPVEEEAL